MRRPRQCPNCGSWFVWAFDAQEVCCMWNGPRWIDNRDAYENAVAYNEWFQRLPECKEKVT